MKRNFIEVEVKIIQERSKLGLRKPRSLWVIGISLARLGLVASQVLPFWSITLMLTLDNEKKGGMR